MQQPPGLESVIPIGMVNKTERLIKLRMVLINDETIGGRSNWHLKAMLLRIWILLFIIYPILLQGQNTSTVLERLQRGQSMHIELLQQSHLLENNPSIDEYPVFPDKLRQGEEELRVGLRLTMEKGEEGRDLLRIKFEYVSYFQFPKEAGEGADTRQMLPDVIDTRYLGNDPSLVRELLETVIVHPLIADISDPRENTISLNNFELWVKSQQIWKNEQLAQRYLNRYEKERIEKTELPKAFSPEGLKKLLAGLLSAAWIESCNYQQAGNFQSKENIHVNFYKTIFLPTKTTLAGRIKNPIEDSVLIEFYKEGSWLRQWQDTLIRLSEDGTFCLNFPSTHARITNIRHGYHTIRIYHEPGDSLFLSTNANSIYRSLEFGGTGPDPSAFLRDFYHQMRGDTLYRFYDRTLLQWDQLAFLQSIQNRQAKELKFLANYPNLSHGFRRLYNREICLHYASIIWEGATRFFENRDLSLDDAYLQYCHQLRSLLYRLPEQRTFDFSIDDYLRFHYTLMNGEFANNPFTTKDYYDLARVLLSGENVLRVGRIRLMRHHHSTEKLKPNVLPIYNDMLKRCKDPVLLRELRDYELDVTWPRGYRYMRRTLPTNKPAPGWAFLNRNEDSIRSSQFAGRFLLLHIGELNRLPSALRDVDEIQLPEKELTVVHLLWGESFENFQKTTGKKEGNFLYIDKTSLPRIREEYRISFNSNHYYLINPEEKVIYNNARLGTPQIIHAVWKKLNAPAVQEEWTSEERLRLWRILGAIAISVIAIGGIFIWRKHLSEQRERRKRRMTELELKGIRSQMNPHFLFNALSSIQNLIRNKKLVNADQYLTRFAGLVRKILRNSEREFITLSEELEAIEQYCGLEALRAPFNYSIIVEETIDVHNTYIPGMLIQPIVENAILHGLMPKAGDRELLINISRSNQGLACEIIDNGIGIEAAKEQKRHHAIERKSYGITLVQNRLQLLGKNVEDTFLSIKDRSALDSKTTGTIVQFIMPTET